MKARASQQKDFETMWPRMVRFWERQKSGMRVGGQLFSWIRTENWDRCTGCMARGEVEIGSGKRGSTSHPLSESNWREPLVSPNVEVGKNRSLGMAVGASGTMLPPMAPCWESQAGGVRVGGAT